MTEAEWVAATDPTAMLSQLTQRASGRKVQLFYCACCRRVYHLLPLEDRRRVTRMAGYYLPDPGVLVGDVWEVAQQTLEVAERFADGVATEGERRDAAEAAQAVSRHFGNIAACAPIPGEDPSYDDAAVKMGSDATAAADCAAWLYPAAVERAVRVATVSAAYDNDSYYAGAHDYPDVDLTHPHLQARRAEQTAQSDLVRDIFGNPFRPVAFDTSLRTEAVVALARGMYESRDFGPMPVLADALDDAGCGDADILAHCRGPGPHVRGCWVVDLVLGKG